MNGLTRGRSRTVQVALAIAATVATVSACGSSDSDGGPSSSGDGGGANVEEAKAIVEEYSAPMTTIDLPPLEKTPEPGRKVVFVTNNQPGSVLLNDAAVDAAEALGWEAIPIVYDSASANGVTAAFAQALEENPDAVVTNSIESTNYDAAKKEFVKRDIPVVVSATTDEVKPPIIANVSGAEDFAMAGKLQAAWAIAQHGDDTSVAMFNVPNFPVLDAVQKGFDETYESLCPDCDFTLVPIQFGDIGTKVPTMAVSELQRNPNINVVVAGFNAVTTGISGALSSAGYTDVLITDMTPTMENLTAIANGSEHMGAAIPLATMGLKSVDALARFFNGEDVSVSTTTGAPLRIITQDNVGDPPALPEMEDNVPLFYKLWGIE